MSRSTELARMVATLHVRHDTSVASTRAIAGVLSDCSWLELVWVIGAMGRLMEYVHGSWADSGGEPHEVPSWDELMMHAAKQDQPAGG